jgi:hypothetical protein
MCLERNIIKAATIADHIVPHRYNPELFWFGALQSLCVDHHNGLKQYLEHKGFSDEIGSDGYPIDPKHPFNQRK